MISNELRDFVTTVVTNTFAQYQQAAHTAQAPAPAPAAAKLPTANAKPERCYPTLDAVRALGYAVPEGATMCVLTSTGKLWYYAALPSGARESFDAYHAPTKREVAKLRAQFAQA